MNSFTVTAVGNLAKNPELVVKGDTTYTKVHLVGNDYAGKDEQGNAREAVTSIWFVAFENLGEAIAKNARKGDQLIVQAQIRANNWTDKDGEKQYDLSFVIQSFRFGAPGRIKREELVEKKSIEVGNIFSLATRFSDALSLKFKAEDGKTKAVIMGSYGIGPARLMGTIVEVLSDEKGIVWPEGVAPFPVHLISVGTNEDVIKEADRIYEMLRDEGIEALYDDRDARAGEKFADGDLLGIPTRIVVSEKTMAQGAVEAVNRADGTTTLVPESGIIEYLKH